MTIVGSQVKMNSGGSPGRGQGQAIMLPRLPGEAEPEESEDVTLGAAPDAPAEQRHCRGHAPGAGGHRHHRWPGQQL